MEYIYQILNLKNGKFYLGSTIQPRIRKLKHFNELRKNKHHCIHLQRAFNKYGENNFIFIILETCSNGLKREQELLDKIDFEDSYNVSKSASGGDLISNHPNKDNIVKKITEKLLQSPKPKPRYKENNSNWRGGKTFFKCPSCGKEYRTTNKQKICISCRDISGENNPFYGKKHSEESKEKMKKASIGKYNGNQNKPVIIKGKEYSSLGQAAKNIGVCVATIYNRINNPKFGEYQYK